MSHVDDGTIHAWLDGALLPGDPERLALEAHLEECDVCRARVDAERGIRDRATDVLRTVAPDAVRVEPFEKMIAARRAARTAGEAEATAPVAGPVPGRVDSATPITRAPRRRRYVPLAWAASLLMAVSAGWFARAWLPPDLAPSSPAMEADLDQAELQERPMASRVAPGEEGAVPPATPAPTMGAVAAEGGAGGVGVRRDAAEPARSGLAERQETAKTEAENRAASGGLRSAEETKRLADAITLDDARAREAAAPSLSLQALLIPDTDPLNEANVAVLESYRLATWETVSEEEASARLGRVAARIEGLPVDSLQSAPHGAGWLVRVVQSIGSGEHAEILQWREAVALDELVVTGVAGQKSLAARSAVDSVMGRGVAADTGLGRAIAADSMARRRERQAGVAAAAPPPPPGAEPLAANRATLRLRSIGFQALLRANVSTDSLAALAQRIR